MPTGKARSPRSPSRVGRLGCTLWQPVEWLSYVAHLCAKCLKHHSNVQCPACGAPLRTASSRSTGHSLGESPLPAAWFLSTSLSSPRPPCFGEEGEVRFGEGWGGGHFTPPPPQKVKAWPLPRAPHHPLPETCRRAI